MDVCFRSLDVVVEVISECLNMGYGLGPPLRSEMPWEQNLYQLTAARVDAGDYVTKGHIADFSIAAV